MGSEILGFLRTAITAMSLVDTSCTPKRNQNTLNHDSVSSLQIETLDAEICIKRLLRSSIVAWWQQMGSRICNLASVFGFCCTSHAVYSSIQAKPPENMICNYCSEYIFKLARCRHKKVPYLHILYSLCFSIPLVNILGAVRTFLLALKAVTPLESICSVFPGKTLCFPWAPPPTVMRT